MYALLLPAASSDLLLLPAPSNRQGLPPSDPLRSHSSTVYSCRYSVKEMGNTCTRKGQRLCKLCASDVNKATKIKKLLDDLSMDERRDVVNFKDEVSES